MGIKVRRNTREDKGSMQCSQADPILGMWKNDSKMTVIMFTLREMNPPTTASAAGKQISINISMARGMQDTIKLLPMMMEKVMVALSQKKLPKFMI